MNRYHKKLYFPDKEKLISFINILNNIEWQYTAHCLNNLNIRFGDKQKILLFIKDLKLDYNNIFEYYMENNKIIKICYRINYSIVSDLIIVIGEFKQIITIYLNDKEDNHYTLKENLYCKA